MLIHFSFHALQRMQERGITIQEVKETLNHPDATRQKENTLLAMKLRRNHRLLIVIYVHLDNKKNVITVIDTSKVRKYF